MGEGLARHGVCLGLLLVWGASGNALAQEDSTTKRVEQEVDSAKAEVDKKVDAAKAEVERRGSEARDEVERRARDAARPVTDGASDAKARVKKKGEQLADDVVDAAGAQAERLTRRAGRIASVVARRKAEAAVRQLIEEARKILGDLALELAKEKLEPLAEQAVKEATALAEREIADAVGIAQRLKALEAEMQARFEALKTEGEATLDASRAEVQAAAQPYLDALEEAEAKARDALALVEEVREKAHQALELVRAAAEAGKQAAELAKDPSKVPAAFQEFLGSNIAPSPIVAAAPPLVGLCRMMTRGRYGANASYWIPPVCYAYYGLGGLMILATSLLGADDEEETDYTSHHLSTSVYLLDYEKQSAITGRLNRPVEGGGWGYDLEYEYDHPKWGYLGYLHWTWQESAIAKSDWMYLTSFFMKADMQAGIDLGRLLTSGLGLHALGPQRLFARVGPSYFRTFVRMGDRGSGLDVPIEDSLGQSVPLVSAYGYEVAAQADIRLPYEIGGFRLFFERGTYPFLNFADITPDQAALVALINFDDLRQGDEYTWQKLKAEVELPVFFSPAAGISLAGHTVRYENNRGSAVSNRGASITYNWRWK